MVRAMKAKSSFLVRWIRPLVLGLSFFIGALLVLYYYLSIGQQQLLIIRIGQAFSFLSLALLYLSLLIGPFYEAFPSVPYRNLLVRSRRSVGVSAFFFALFHTLVSFFGQLYGFAGLGFLSKSYLTAIVFGFIALLIMSAMALTSFDYWVTKLGRWWKFIHRFIYAAGWLIVFHVFMIGTHFTDLASPASITFISALIFLLILEALRIDKSFLRRYPQGKKYGLSFVILFALISVGAYTTLFGGNGQTSFGIHAQHIQLAKQTQATASQGTTNVPGLTGDRSKRYTVSFNRPTAAANQDINLNFSVYDASNGNQVFLFGTVYEKPVHLIIVDSELNYFSHIHPTQQGNSFSVTTQLPKDGLYHLYLDFQPFGAIEQQFAFTLPVGQVPNAARAQQPADQSLTKTFGDYSVSLDFPRPLRSAAISVGEQQLRFTLKDKNTQQPVVNLKPYLAAFGHLVMINEETYDYIHVHPADLTAPGPDANGGPIVSFMPLGLYGPIKPGTYRVFAQFNPNNQLMLADFTIKVE